MANIAQTVGQILQQQVLTAAQLVEEKVDEEIKELDELKLDDIETLRERRLEQIKKQQKLKQEYRAKGHGEYVELKDQKEFFETTKKSLNVVVHFYRTSVPRCKIVDHHLNILARKHLETKFCKILADSSMFLAERLNIHVIPTLALIKDSILKDRIVGFTELGNCDNFSTEMLEWRIATVGVIDYEGDILHPPEKTHMSKVSANAKKHTIRGRDSDSSEDEDLE